MEGRGQKERWNFDIEEEGRGKVKVKYCLPKTKNRIWKEGEGDTTGRTFANEDGSDYQRQRNKEL